MALNRKELNVTTGQRSVIDLTPEEEAAAWGRTNAAIPPIGILGDIATNPPADVGLNPGVFPANPPGPITGSYTPAIDQNFGGLPLADNPGSYVIPPPPAPPLLPNFGDPYLNSLFAGPTTPTIDQNFGGLAVADNPGSYTLPPPPSPPLTPNFGDPYLNSLFAGPSTAPPTAPPPAQQEAPPGYYYLNGVLQADYTKPNVLSTLV